MHVVPGPEKQIRLQWL